MFGAYEIAVQVSELRYVTDEGVAVFDGLSFSLPREGIRFVVGPPLSGKTLLLKLILRELRPTKGQILVAGKNVLRLSPRKFRAFRKHIGYLPYPPVVLEGRTVEENILFKLRALGIGGEQGEEGLQKALSLTGLEPLRDLPVEELGELQRVLLGLAVGICNDPPVLLCDDPFRDITSQVDKERLLRTLEAIRRGGISILATTREGELLRRSGVSEEDIVLLRPEVTV